MAIHDNGQKFTLMLFSHQEVHRYSIAPKTESFHYTNDFQTSMNGTQRKKEDVDHNPVYM